MNKIIQILYGLRDFIYALVLGFFGWGFAEYDILFASPLASVQSFFTYPWVQVYLGLNFIAMLVEVFVCPMQMQPDRKPWRRWRGLIMESILVCAIFCDHYGILPLSKGDAIRWVGVGVYLLSIGLIFWNGMIRSKQIKLEGEETFPETGMFSVVRYPEFLAQAIYTISVAFLFNTWISLVILVDLVVFQYRYTKKEDVEMRKKYGKVWLDYCQVTRRIIPWLL